MIAEYGHDDALFLSLQKKRISMDTIELMISKYTTALFGEDYRISPKDLCFSYRDYVFHDTRNVSATANACGVNPGTIFNYYKSDVLEYKTFNPFISS